MEIVGTIFDFVFRLGVYIFFAVLYGGLSVCVIYFLAPKLKYKNETGLFIALIILSGLYLNENGKAAEFSETIENLDTEMRYIEENFNEQIYRLEEQQSFLEGCFEFSFSSFYSPENFKEIVLTEPREEIVELYETMYDDAKYYYNARDEY